MVSNKPIRILHVVGGMNRGGIETWLMHVLRHIDRKRFAMDFLVHTSETCILDSEIEALGAKIIHCPHPNGSFVYTAHLRTAINRAGGYDVIHSHVHHYSGVVLRTARKAGVGTRIAHSHIDTACVDAAAGFLRRGYLGLTWCWISKSATCKLAASRLAGESLYGGSATGNGWKILPYGIDLRPFHERIDRSEVRREFNIPPGAFVVGHAGRFVEQKNHAFVVRIAAELALRNPNVYFLMIGEGPLRSSIEHQVAAAGLTNRFRFTGVRPDVPRLMSGAMDAFLFPSLNEGLGLVLVEGQAAGLPCFYSDVVPEEADIVRALVHRLSLGQPASEWADAILSGTAGKTSISRHDGLGLVEKSPFSIDNSVARLEEVYTCSGA